MLIHDVTRVAASVLDAIHHAGLPEPEFVGITTATVAEVPILDRPPRVTLDYGNDRRAVDRIANELFDGVSVHQSADYATASTEWASGIVVAASARPDHARVWGDQQVVDKPAVLDPAGTAA
ncbi:hypothetical protein [Phytoactinopolyspora limicola]|uniref:hypothetical protein n=1 Tax=Phytoactinopolyspora limicola TaxID=2715536 RepID=UPI00140D47BE|nr:hypothetical protein [Phytoactinopolyspora limicola]